jgi:hypothetical protein
MLGSEYLGRRLRGPDAQIIEGELKILTRTWIIEAVSKEGVHIRCVEHPSRKKCISTRSVNRTFHLVPERSDRGCHFEPA